MEVLLKMKTFIEALHDGFEAKTSIKTILKQAKLKKAIPEATLTGIDYWTFEFGDNEEYKLNFEPLLFEDQYYVALYRNQELLTEKVLIKPGYVKENE